MNQEKITQDISNLQKDISLANLILGRIDVTLDKLTDVASNLSRLMAVMEIRVNNIEKKDDETQKKLQENRNDISHKNNLIHKRIDEVVKSLKEETEAKDEKVIDELI